MPQAKREEHILGAMERSIKDFESRYSGFDNGSISLYTGDGARDDLDKEVFICEPLC